MSFRSYSDPGPGAPRRRRRNALCILLLAGWIGLGLSGQVSAEEPLLVQEPRGGRELVIVPGDPVLHLVFFATWCPPCVEELTRLTEIEARWGERGYRLILVAVRTRQTTERLVKFIDRHQPPGTLVFDLHGRVQAAFRSDQLPTHVLLDRSGAEAFRSGSLDAGLEAAIAAMLTGDRQ